MRFTFCWKSCFVLLSVLLFHEAKSFSYPEERVVERSPVWPTTMHFHETKTNYMLGEALLKRIYTRMDFVENLIRLESSQLYEKIKDEMQRSFRKCDRKRRRADNLKGHNSTSTTAVAHGLSAAKLNKQGDKKGKRERKTWNEGQEKSGYQFN